MAAPETTSFAHHFETLRHHVERLRTLDVAELDELVTLVSEAGTAYRQCKARIEAVRLLLNETLQQPAGEVATP